MTPQERAAAFAEQIVRALDVHPSPINIDAVLPWVKQTRRAALLETAQVIRERAEFIAHDYDIEPIGELEWFERERIVQAAEDFITQLDRLAQEGS